MNSAYNCIFWSDKSLNIHMYSIILCIDHNIIMNGTLWMSNPPNGTSLGTSLGTHHLEYSSLGIHITQACAIDTSRAIIAIAQLHRNELCRAEQYKWKETMHFIQIYNALMSTFQDKQLCLSVNKSFYISLLFTHQIKVLHHRPTCTIC